MPPATFEAAYPTDLWTALDRNQRPEYSDILLEVWRQKNVFAQFTPVKIDINHTTQLYWDMMFDLEPNTNAIGLRDLWLDAMRSDSQRVGITTEHHAGKVQLHKHDSYINRWRKEGQPGLDAIVRNLLANSVSDHMDILVRNAYLNSPFATYAMDDSYGGFDDLTGTDTYNWEWGSNARLQASTLNLPGFDPDTPNTIVAITSPSSIFAMERDTSAREYFKYTGDGINRIFRHELGGLNGVRYIESPRCILWNAGKITRQATIKAAAAAGSGGHNWATYIVGQSGATPYLQLDTGSAAFFKVNDIVTVHQVRTSKWGVTNGVDVQDGMTFNRIVKWIDTGTDRIGFDRPILWDFTTDLGGTVYGYVTKAMHVHATIYIFGPGAVVAGITQPVTTHIPPVIDDTQSLFRFSWDAYIKDQIFRPEWCEVVFHAGQIRMGGAPTIGGE
jgi:hypothetical protein